MRNNSLFYADQNDPVEGENCCLRGKAHCWRDVFDSVRGDGIQGTSGGNSFRNLTGQLQ